MVGVGAGAGRGGRTCPPPGLGMLGTQRAGRSDPYARRVRPLVCGSRPGAGVRRARWRAARGRRRRQRRGTSTPRTPAQPGQGGSCGLCEQRETESPSRACPSWGPAFIPTPPPYEASVYLQSLPAVPSRHRRRGPLRPPEAAPPRCRPPIPAVAAGSRADAGEAVAPASRGTFCLG